ncbi:DUF1697 domain-containing protein [filamentous cyanobacterium LEGE 11480]|uniref:DUF1697 domain-containing protein n=1 Tax=Romeriopsis navalis LEGE 11480 TaxID=2777977 RepID=A0A928VKE4_9CYAN|nr:DUF1697 domain-containing protein [Romeriopsis navalis]MBE9029955.1 DUF1697 domain-containing protein [Romeriopsis navalis LEGE 11480]
MPSYVAFLRAVNVGGRQVKMDKLAEHFKSLGHEDAQTFLTTGNVIFEATDQTSIALGEQMESPIEELLGFRSEVFVRNTSELQAILATAKTLLPNVPNNGALNVAFLKAPLTEAQAEILDGLSSPIDEFLVQGTELYWTCRAAQNSSKCSNGIFESKLKLRSTLRPVGMLTELTEKFFA